MKLFIQNTSLNRVLLALAVSVAVGGVASAAPAGTVTCTVTTPGVGSTYPVNQPTPFAGNVSGTANVNAVANYKYYFFSYGYVTYPINTVTLNAYANVPFNAPINTTNGSNLPANYYLAKLECTLSASGRTDASDTASNSFAVR